MSGELRGDGFYGGLSRFAGEKVWERKTRFFCGFLQKLVPKRGVLMVMCGKRGAFTGMFRG